MSDQTILVVEDDLHMQRLLSTDLAARGFEVRVASDGEEALRSFGAEPVHLVLLDIALPGGMNGLEVCSALRAIAPVPILMLTVMSSAEMKVEALGLGADDYLTKPFHSDELVARVRALLRRASGAQVTPVTQIGDLTVNLAHREVTRDGKRLHLTKIEFDILRTLVVHPDRVLTYRELLQAVWGPNYNDMHAIHVHMSLLRRKIENRPGGPRYVLAVPGVGYRLLRPA